MDLYQLKEMEHWLLLKPLQIWERNYGLEKHTLAPPCAKPVTGLPKHAVFHNPIPPAELLPGGRSGNIVEAACPETCCQAACFYNYSILSHIVR